MLLLPIAMVVAFWAFLVVGYAGGFGGPLPVARLLIGAFVALSCLAAPFVHKRGWLLLAAVFVTSTLGWAMVSPQKDREWSEVSARTPYATKDGQNITIHDIRDFRYNADGTWTAHWYDKTFNLDDIEQGYLVLTRFGGIDGLAHVMASFRFKGDQFIVLSAEIRREDGESYDPIGGAMRQYELYYVAADERDAIALRTQVQKDETWLIPMNAGKEKTAEFFVSMVDRITKIHNEPEWYNSITSSCASNLASHYEAVNKVSFPPDYRILLPGFSEELVAELGLLPEGMSVEDARKSFKINEVAVKAPLDDSFSRVIRGENLANRNPPN
ncbi:MAG: DUF4105 domain-containing protein [bacterium]